MSGHTVFYALGGGRGHATRAFELARRVGGDCRVLHQAEGEWPTASLGRIRVERLRETLHEALVGARQLVVDTFPGGIAHELELPQHVRTVLVARYVDRPAYPDYDALAARFDAVWLPYTRETSEWDHPPCADRAEWIGPVVRPVQSKGSVDTLVIGSGEPASWRPLLAGAKRIDRPYRSLPRPRRVVALAAGYNLGHELAALGVPVAFRPRPRRFDDQFRRAARLGHPLYHRADLEGFLGRSDWRC